MAEALALTTGILTVIDVTAKLISKCKKLIEDARDAPRDLRHIMVELSSLKSVLENLKFLADADSEFSDTVKKMDKVDGAVKGCGAAVEKLSEELDGLILEDPPDAKISKGQRLKTALIWSLKERSRARKLLGDIGEYKATISLTLIHEVATDVKEVKDSIVKVKDGVEEVKNSVNAVHTTLIKWTKATGSTLSTEYAVCQWLQRNNPGNPTMIHSAARRLQDPNTCRWVLELPSWRKWLAGKERCLWICGIPGSGKTVLTSFLIEQALEHCERKASHKYIYYYCSYRHNQDETLPFLKWIISQLCRITQFVPANIRKMYQEAIEPHESHLKVALMALLDKLKVLYIFLDAVDESNPREELLHFLSSLLSDPEFNKIHFVVSSREYIDIADILEPLSSPISMRNSKVDDDIRTYADSILAGKRRFARWPAQLRMEVREALVKGAKSMFRWVECQLEILQRNRSLQSEEDVRITIQQLPPTLDETYVRILQMIPESDWPFARAALLFICGHDELPFECGIPDHCLVSAVLEQVGHIKGRSLRPTLFDHVSLLEICGCLIRVLGIFNPSDGDNYQTIGLSHYTVREYLYSARIPMSPVSYFALNKGVTAHQFLKTTLFAAIGVSHSNTFRSVYGSLKSLDTYSAVVSWLAPSVWETFIVQNDQLWELQIRYYRSTSSSVWLQQVREACRWAAGDDELTRIIKLPKQYRTVSLPKSASYPRAATNAQILCALLLDEHFNMARRFSQDLELEDFTCGCVYEDFEVRSILLDSLSLLNPKALGVFRSIIQARKDVLITSVWSFSKRHCSHDPEILEWLCRNGACTDPIGFTITPLQIATQFECHSAVSILLKGGANVNGIGNPKGRIPPGMDTFCEWCPSTPLHIVRNSSQEIFSLNRKRSDKSNIERLLLSYGAEDFNISEEDLTVASSSTCVTVIPNKQSMDVTFLASYR